jgi:adenine-specific DNA methylase
MRNAQFADCYDPIEIDKNEIEQTLLDIERKRRSNLFAWNGQFSPQLIETLLNRYAENGNIVLDPFLGSGTVLYECARKKLSAFGVELNPSAYFMAKTYELCALDINERDNLIQTIENILSVAFENRNPLAVL